MFSALFDSMRSQSGFISQRLGVSLVLLVAGVASATYFVNNGTIAHQASSASELGALESSASGASQGEIDPSASASASLASSADQAGWVGAEQDGDTGQLSRTDATKHQNHSDNLGSAAGIAGSGTRSASGTSSAKKSAREVQLNSSDGQTVAAESAPDSEVEIDMVAGNELLTATNGMTEQTYEQASGEEVLHITNVGDKIIVTHDQEVADAAVRQRSEVESTQQIDQVSEGSLGEEELAEVPQADYEELYPGCPRALPAGSDEQMAKEMLGLYGCLYLSVCNSATDEIESTCTWYLNQKITS